ncbi:hypothetical protein MRB53_021245 [Persea americana]|uniref:Uncharacterized protein n=1 Tax=Persea americana TaxID=3435 RepID=A0ACC2L3T0_PERAE|nr:hypothetical protein MRB53_021245 [Persea americana]
MRKKSPNEGAARHESWQKWCLSDMEKERKKVATSIFDLAEVRWQLEEKETEKRKKKWAAGAFLAAGVGGE